MSKSSKKAEKATATAPTGLSEKEQSRLEELQAEITELLAEFRPMNLKKSTLDEKGLKKLAKLKSTLDLKREERDALKAKLKPAKKERVTKYDYPAGATSEEKKAIRTQARAAAKKAAKAAAGGGEKASKKAEKKAAKKEAEVAPAKKAKKEEKPAKKEKKSKKED